jgi:hypothetical protein
MEAKVDLCSSGLIIERRRYELEGLDCQDRGSLQVHVSQPVAESEWDALDLINPASSAVIDRRLGHKARENPLAWIPRV